MYYNFAILVPTQQISNSEDYPSSKKDNEYGKGKKEGEARNYEGNQNAQKLSKFENQAETVVKRNPNTFQIDEEEEDSSSDVTGRSKTK